MYTRSREFTKLQIDIFKVQQTVMFVCGRLQDARPACLPHTNLSVCSQRENKVRLCAYNIVSRQTPPVSTTFT